MQLVVKYSQLSAFCNELRWKILPVVSNLQWTGCKILPVVSILQWTGCKILPIVSIYATMLLRKLMLIASLITLSLHTVLKFKEIYISFFNQRLLQIPVHTGSGSLLSCSRPPSQIKSTILLTTKPCCHRIRVCPHFRLQRMHRTRVTHSIMGKHPIVIPPIC